MRIFGTSLFNLFLGASFALVENFGNQQTQSLVLSQNFLQIQNLHRNYFDCDSAFAESRGNSQNLARGANPNKSFCYFLLLQKVESSLSYQLQSTKKGKFAESTLDSATQNLTRKVRIHTPSRHAEGFSPKYPFKSFCYFWLLPKVESFLP